MRNKVKSSHGFTLMEILMAFTILVSGIVGVYALFSVGVVSHKRAVDNTIAATLAGSVFDDIAANYAEYYYDKDNNGVPDLSELDRNNNGVDDWLEHSSEGLRYPIPYRRRYSYKIRYEYSSAVSQEIFVTLKVQYFASGKQISETFRRAIYIRRLPAIKAQN